MRIGKGLNLKVMFINLAIVTFVLTGFTVYFSIVVQRSYVELKDTTKKYYQADHYISEFIDASDYLCEQSKLYVVNQNLDHLNNYFYELTKKVRRQIAMAKLDEITTGDEISSDENPAADYLMESLLYSDELAELDTHAMKLVALANNVDMEMVDDEIKNFRIPQDELALSNDKKIALALNLIYGKNYQDVRQKMQENQKIAKKIINDYTRNNQNLSFKHLSISIVVLEVFFLLSVIVVFILIMTIEFLLIKPIEKFVVQLKSDEPLDIVPSMELGYFAATYNLVNQQRKESTLILKEKAERDALTKLLNRQVFQQNAALLAENKTPMILILLDIDSFKHINDNYGHDTGDKLIIKVAHLFRDYLGGDSDTYRIGGDEFIVFIRNKDTSYYDKILESVKKINELLSEPEDNFPESSISAGAAYSEDGYSKKLYNNADQALYFTKEHGKCGISFFEKI